MLKPDECFATGIVAGEQGEQIVFEREELEPADQLGSEGALGDALGEQGLGGLGDDWPNLGWIEVRTSDEQKLDDATTDGGVGQEFTQDSDARRLVQSLGDREEFIRAGSPVQLTDEFGDKGRTDLRVERERGEHASFGGQRLRFRRSQERGNGLGLTLEIHAD